MTEKTGPKSGECPYCGSPTKSLTYHARYCLHRAVSVAATDELAARDRYEVRAAAHAIPGPSERAAQRWQGGVTDENVALVMYAIERGVTLIRNRVGRWLAPTDAIGYRKALGRELSTVVNEMIRTGLLRHFRPVSLEGCTDYLIPALVHLRGPEGTSACMFTGEDMGPMRARLVDDLSLVDCLECEAVVARGYPRGL